MQYIEEIMAEKSTSDEVVDAFNLIDEDGSGEVSHEEVSVLGAGGVFFSFWVYSSSLTLLL